MAQMHTETTQDDKYYLPHNSPWPILGSVALFAIMAGAISFLNGWAGGFAFLPGVLLLAGMFFGWFYTVIGENQRGVFNLHVDRSFRMGMIWFIFSEVMFFAAFFGALFYVRQFAVPWIGGEGAKTLTGQFLWHGFNPAWPNNGPAHLGPRANGTFETVPAFGLPAVNTLVLLTSGLTVTLAHHALKADRRTALKIWLACTFLLGFLFLGLQIHEFGDAYRNLGLRLSTGIYGSTFFMLTGFHGLHVTIGAIMLLIIWLRVMRGHFSPERHFAFEGVAWYWHFVDVVWLCLFIFVYWL